MSDMIRILIADDHAIVREGLRALIATEPGLQLVAEAVDGADAVDKFKALKPDIVLLDMLMPRKSGLEAIAEIVNFDSQARILVLTSFADDEKVFPAIKSGALGYLLKDSAPQELLQAIHHVYNREASLHPTIARKLMRELTQPSALPPANDPLTEREVEILQQVAQGLSNDEISQQLFLALDTVKGHNRRIFGKLQVQRRTEAIIRARELGLL